MGIAISAPIFVLDELKHFWLRLSPPENLEKHVLMWMAQVHVNLVNEPPDPRGDFEGLVLWHAVGLRIALLGVFPSLDWKALSKVQLWSASGPGLPDLLFGRFRKGGLGAGSDSFRLCPGESGWMHPGLRCHRAAN